MASKGLKIKILNTNTIMYNKSGKKMKKENEKMENPLDMRAQNKSVALSEISKLKTLKDFNYLYETATVDDLRNQLRKEAIAYILEIQALIKEKKGKWDDFGFDMGMEYAEQGSAMIAWITFFFNLTDKDLVNE